MPADIRKKVERLIRIMVSAEHVRGLYGEEHKITKETMDTLYSVLEDILKDKNEITIGIVGNEIAFEDEPFYEMSKQIRGFIDHLKKIKAEKFSFSKGIDKRELSDFIAILTEKPEAFEKGDGLERAFIASNIRNIAFGKVGFKKGEPVTPEDVNAVIKAGYKNGVDFLTQASEDIKKSRPIDVKSARQLANSIISNLLKNKNLLLILTSTRSHDESTFVHDINVSIFTLLQAEALGLGQEYLSDIGTAALLHDVGKLSIPVEILKKKGKLTEQEKKKMIMHPVNGAKILLETPGINVLAAIGAFEHHVRYDLGGYPERLFKKKGNLASMMIAIADYYDAVRSKRYYHDEMAPEKTYEDMMELSGKYFHPDLLNNFFSVIGVYPPGTLVELDTREIGLVVKESATDLKRPQVEVLYDNRGKVVKTPYTVNLLEKDKRGKHKYTIIRSVMASEKFKIPNKYL
jgi:HD-GYP domain-containing protein (c-di-GMP phosphodiesterase class II)